MLVKPKLALALGLALSLACAGSAQAATGLAGHWPFNEGSGTTAHDTSGFADNGALSGGTQWIPGQAGSALRFDGTTGRVTVARNAVLEPAAVTVEAWVRRSGNPGGFHYIVSKGATNCDAASYGLYSGPTGGLAFYVAGPGGLQFTRSAEASDTSVWDGAWHLATGTYDGTSVQLYLDGAPVGAPTPGSLPIGYGLPTSNDLFVGDYAGCGGLGFAGDVDNVRIYNRALSAAEVPGEMKSTYDFRGFFAPVNNAPTVNTVKAGSAIPVKFSLSGNQGLGIMAAGSPSSQGVTCDSGAPVDAIEQTVTAGSSTLTYDSSSDTYSYVWKSDKSWAGTCRQLVVNLDDGTTHTARFQFR